MALELTVELLLTVLEGVACAVPELLCVALAVPEPLLLPLLVALEERAMLLLTEALAPGDREAVALPLTVELALCVLLGVGAAVPVAELL